MPCDKIGYPTRHAAVQAIKTFRTGRNKQYNTYVCYCGEIHVYTVSKKKNKFWRKHKKKSEKYPIKVTDFIIKP